MTSTRDWRRVLGVLCTGPGVELALSVRPSLSLPLIMFDHAFHASLTDKSCIDFSRRQNVHSQILALLQTFHQINRLRINMDKTKMMAIDIVYYATYTRKNHYMWCTTSNILVLMSHQQIGGMYVI